MSTSKKPENLAAALLASLKESERAATNGPRPFDRDRALNRLDRHLRKLYSLADQANIPAALMVLSDVQSDLDDIQALSSAGGEPKEGTPR